MRRDRWSHPDQTVYARAQRQIGDVTIKSVGIGRFMMNVAEDQCGGLVRYFPAAHEVKGGPER